MIALIGDGTAMYTVQALWTMARSSCNVVSIIFNNASYSVLNVELERVGADEVGPKAQPQLDLSGPTLNFALLAQGMGARGAHRHGRRLHQGAGIRSGPPGPHLIEALVPESLSGAKRKGAALAAALAAAPATGGGAGAQAQDCALVF